MATTYDLIVEAHAISAAIETEEQEDAEFFGGGERDMD